MTVLERRRWKLLSFSMECRTRISGICCYRCSGVRQSSTTAEPSWRDSWHSGEGFVVVAADVVAVVVDVAPADVVAGNVVAVVVADDAVAGTVVVFPAATGRVVVAAAAAAVAPSSACSSFGLKVENYLVFAGQRGIFYRLAGKGLPKRSIYWSDHRRILGMSHRMH